MPRRRVPPTPSTTNTPAACSDPPRRTTVADLRERVLTDFAALRVPLRAEQFDAALGRAERDGLSHLEFVHLLLSEQADGRRQRSIAHRIDEAHFRDGHSLANFDWQFNAPAINRSQIEDLATGDFIRRKDNLVLVGQSGVGKSHIVESIGRTACALGYRVRYTTSAGLIEHLTAALADQTLPRRVRKYARFDLLIVDEFGFDRLERREARDAASLLFKVIDARVQKCSTALVTNIEFDAWGEYLGDAPLAMALLDRIVDGAVIVRINGKSYRAARAHAKGTSKPDNS
jgi:DNA replication protein DnaC